MELGVFHLLTCAAGQAAIQAALELHPREADFLHCFTVLERLFPTDLARAALETAILRQEAASKFPSAERMYFTRPALEQATGFEISGYRVKRFHGFDQLVDAGCSIGGDTLALAPLAHTTGLDLNPLRLAMAQSNMTALGLGENASFICANLTYPLPFSPFGSKAGTRSSLALFFDPSRRDDQRRAFSVHSYSPPLDVIEDWLPRVPALGVKISPGVKLEEIGKYDAEVEFISLRGELKEAVLWFGPLKTCRRRATLLPGPHTLAAAPDRLDQEPCLSEPLAFFYEPDPAILRAGLVRALGAQIGAAQLDPSIAYLTSDQLVRTPFARAWVVEAWFPFGMKRLRAALRERHVGQVVVKKRGSPLQPEELMRALRLRMAEDAEERVIFLTQLRGRPITVLCYKSMPF